MDSLRDLVSKIGQEKDSNTNSLINYPVIFKRICEHVRVLLPKDANLHSWVVLPDEIGIKYGGEISNSEMLNISKAIYDEFGIGVSFSKIFPKQKSEQKT